MTKRMTLLARKEGGSTSDFRNYWAGPHAKLALGMEGITRYVHNRVDKVLWAAAGSPAFNVDGIVELFFAGPDAMALAQASSVGKKFIPEDEPVFLKGWTLCVVETDGFEPSQPGVKVVIPFHAPLQAREPLFRELSRAAAEMRARATLDWTVSTATRERLWAEPNPPDGFIFLWVESVARAHEAFEPSSEWRRVVEAHVDDAVAYLMDVLYIR
jgi:hypothetical protein